MINQSVISLMTEVYGWLNQILDPSITFQKKDFERYFTSDFIMDLNDNIDTKGYDALFDHFEACRLSGYLLKVQLPFKEIFTSEDGKKCVARYNITETSPDYKNREMKVVAIWHIASDGRLQRMNQVIFFEGDTIAA